MRPDRSLDAVLDRKAGRPMPRWLAWCLAVAILAGGWYLLRDQLIAPR